MKMRRGGLLGGVVLAMATAGMPAMAAASGTAGVTRSTFSDSALSFNYPSSWAVLPAATARSFGGEFAGVGHGVSLADVKGVRHTASGTGAVAVIVKLALSRSLQRQIHGHELTFVNGVLTGIANSAGIHVLHRGNGRFGGRPARVIDAAVGGKSAARQEYYVALAGNERAAYMAIFVAVPPRVWNTYRASFNSIARSVQFH